MADRARKMKFERKSSRNKIYEVNYEIETNQSSAKWTISFAPWTMDLAMSSIVIAIQTFGLCVFI